MGLISELVELSILYGLNVFSRCSLGIVLWSSYSRILWNIIIAFLGMTYWLNVFSRCSPGLALWSSYSCMLWNIIIAFLGMCRCNVHGAGIKRTLVISEILLKRMCKI